MSNRKLIGSFFKPFYSERERPAGQVAMLSPQTKDKVRSLSLLMMVLVVYSHCPTYQALAEAADPERQVWPASWDLFVQYWVYLELPRFVVPLFFAVSGFFLLANRDAYPRFSQFYLYKLRSRLRTVLVPYLIWSVAAVLYPGLLECTLFRRWHRGACLFDLPFTELINRMFVTPVAFHLWFLLALIVLVVAMPIWLWLASRFPKVSLLALALVWFFNQYPEGTRLRIEGVLFFFLGILVATRKFEVPLLPTRLAKPVVAGWLAMTLLNSYLYMVGARLAARFIENVSEIAGIAAIWYIYDIFPTRVREQLLRWSPYGFFLYIVHLPYMYQVLRIVFRLVPRTPMSEVAVLLLLPAFVIVSILACAPFLARRAGPAYRLLTGGR